MKTISRYSLDRVVYGRAEAILEAVVYATDAQDIPSAVELVFLANDVNWVAAGGDPDAIAAKWAFRDMLPLAEGVPVGGAPCGHCGQLTWMVDGMGMPMHACCEGLPYGVPCLACRESRQRQMWRSKS